MNIVRQFVFFCTKGISSIIFIFLCLNQVAYPQQQTMYTKSFKKIWNQVLNIDYPSNPVTHENIKFSSGVFNKKLSDSSKTLRLSFQSKKNYGLIRKGKVQFIAAFMDADSGNGDIYTYLIAFLVKNKVPYPAASLLIEPNIKVLRTDMTDKGVYIVWQRDTTKEIIDPEGYMIGRDYTLRNDSLVDDYHENSVRKKREIMYDTVFTRGVTLNQWDIKWNHTRAIAVSLTGADTVEVFRNMSIDIEDEEAVYYPGDSITPRYNAIFYQKDTNQIVSVAGSYVSYLNSYVGEGGAHMIMGTTLNTLNLDTVLKTSQKTISTQDSVHYWYYDACDSVRKAKITDIFPESDVYKALMKDTIIIASLEKAKPKKLRTLVKSLNGHCVIDFSGLLENFAFKRVKNKKVEVVIGLTNECGYEQGAFTIIEIELPIPRAYEQMFNEVREKKSTMNWINPKLIEIQRKKAYRSDQLD